MNIMRQIVIVSLLGLRGLKTRAWQALVIVAGMCLVIGVMLSMLSMAEGERRAYLQTGDPNAAIVLGQGTEWEPTSNVSRDQARMAMTAPGIARDADGSPIADPGLLVPVPVVRNNGIGGANILLRGMGAKGLMLRPGFHMVEGRMFQPGARELVVGNRARGQFRGMAVGGKVILPDGEWPIVGAFATGDLADGQLLADTDTLMAAIRHNSFTNVMVRLESPAAFPAFRAALHDLPLDVMTVPDWNRKMGDRFSAFLGNMVYGVGVILGLGALFGCFNTMYAAVSARAQETATLRALGYSGVAVAVSVLVEAMLLSLAGALAGAVIAWSLFNGVQSAMGNDVFTLDVSPALFGIAMGWAIVIAVLGGILPSLQAARSTVSDALRAR
jgi:putative ABC transport system permease protein